MPKSKKKEEKPHLNINTFKVFLSFSSDDNAYGHVQAQVARDDNPLQSIREPLNLSKKLSAKI